MKSFHHAKAQSPQGIEMAAVSNAIAYAYESRFYWPDAINIERMNGNEMRFMCVAPLTDSKTAFLGAHGVFARN